MFCGGEIQSADLSMDEPSFLEQALVDIQLDSFCVNNLPGENHAREENIEFYPDLNWIQSFSAWNTCPCRIKLYTNNMQKELDKQL